MAFMFGLNMATIGIIASGFTLLLQFTLKDWIRTIMGRDSPSSDQAGWRQDQWAQYLSMTETDPGAPVSKKARQGAGAQKPGLAQWA